MTKIGWGTSIDGMATWKYEIVPFDAEKQYLVKLPGHPYLGLLLIDKNLIHDIKEVEDEG